MSDDYFTKETYHNAEILRNRKTMRNLSMRHYDNGFLAIRKVKDNEIVFAGKYSKLRELYPQLAV